MSEIPSSPEELIINDIANDIINQIASEGVQSFGVRLVHTGDTFGRCIFAVLPTNIKFNKDIDIDKVASIVRRGMSTRLKAMFVQNDRNWGFDKKLPIYDFQFNQLEINFQALPSPTLRVLYEVSVKVSPMN